MSAPLETVLELPAPPSVNRTRRIDWRGQRRLTNWQARSDMRIMATGGVRRLQKMPGQFEAVITLDDSAVKCDADNVIKHLIDYARRLELIVDDSPKYLRRITMQWGTLDCGCRLILRSMTG